MIRVFRVHGDSMRPGLSEGDFVVALRRRRRPRPGERVVLDHPGYGILVKRVEATGPDGRLRCRGDNPASIEAARLGWIDGDRILGVVWFAVRKPAPA